MYVLWLINKCLLLTFTKLLTHNVYLNKLFRNDTAITNNIDISY